MDANTNDTDPTRINVASGGGLALPPRWAGDLDAYAPGAGDEWARSLSMTGGATVVDEVALNITALLHVNVYELKDGGTEAFADLSVQPDRKCDIPVSLGYRTAAALALLQSAFENNAPEPTNQQVDELENLIRDAARRLTAARASTTVGRDKEN